MGDEPEHDGDVVFVPRAAGAVAEEGEFLGVEFLREDEPFGGICAVTIVSYESGVSFECAKTYRRSSCSCPPRTSARGTGTSASAGLP